MKVANLAQMTTATIGTGTITLGAAVAGYLTFALAGIANGDVVRYAIRDGANSEMGYGTYSSTGPTLTRNVLKSTNSNAAINLSGSAAVAVTPAAEDLSPLFDTQAVNTFYAGPTSGSAAAAAFRVFGAADLAATVLNPAASMINGKIVESHAANAVTFALKTLAGNDPSAADPVAIIFRGSVATAEYVLVFATTATSITIPASQALGASNGVAFHVYICAINNSGTVELAVQNFSDSTHIYPFNEHRVLTTVAVAVAPSAGVMYSTTVRSSVVWRALARATYESGLTTAGTWDAAPTRIAPMMPGAHRPGDVVQAVQAVANSFSTSSTSPASSNLTASLAAMDGANLVKVSWSGSVMMSTMTAAAFLQLYRGATVLGPSYQFWGDAAVDGRSSLGGVFLDKPNSTAPTYTVKGNVGSGSCTLTFGVSNGDAIMLLQEMQG